MSKEKELIKKFDIDISRLREEQEKLSKKVSLIDVKDFFNIEFFGAFSNILIQNKILSAVVVMNKSGEIIEQKYFVDRAKFPYLAEFRAYRELPAMLSALSQLDQKPEIVFVDGLGINHLRLGIASHFSISCGIPCVGITDNQINFSVEDGKLLLNNKEVGVMLQTKKGSKPLFVSPGSGISISSAGKLVSSLVKPPHKLPEPMRVAKKYVKKVKKEVFS